VSNLDKKGSAGPFAVFHIYFAAAAVFLLPLKFGNIVGVPEAPMFWDNSFLWILESYPALLFPMVSCALFISAFAAGGGEFSVELDMKAAIALLWLALAVSSLAGFLDASVLDFPIIFCLHFFGLAIFAFAVLATLRLREDAGDILLRALILGTCATMFFSLHQMLWGFEDSMDFVREREARTGVKVSHDLWLRIEQTRVFSPFSLCNSLGAHIILMLPVVVAGIFGDKATGRWAMAISATSIFLFVFDGHGMAWTIMAVLLLSFLLSLLFTSFYGERWRYLCIGFSPAFALFMLFVLKHTFSRGAVASLGFALFAIPFFLKMPRRMKFAYMGALAVLFVVFFAVVNQNRSLLEASSLHARVDYWLCAGKIFLGHPAAGTGWGDFFHEYTTIKSFPGTETPHTAHNMVLDFASQCGLPGLLAIIGLACGSIFAAGIGAARSGGAFFCRFGRLAIFCGLAAWLLHSLTDINFQVPATMGSAIVLSLVAANGSLWRPRRLPFANLAVMAIVFAVIFFCGRRLRFEMAFERLHRICDPIVLDEKNPDLYSPRSMEKALKAAVVAGPYSPYPWAAAGNYAQSRENWAASEKFFSEALKRSPERASFHARLALALVRMGRYGDALDKLRRASELFPNNKEYEEQYSKMRKILERKNEE